MSDDARLAQKGVDALEKALKAAEEMMVQDYGTGFITYDEYGHVEHVLFKKAIRHLQKEFFGTWIPKEGGSK